MAAAEVEGRSGETPTDVSIAHEAARFAGTQLVFELDTLEVGEASVEGHAEAAIGLKAATVLAEAAEVFDWAAEAAANLG